MKTFIVYNLDTGLPVAVGDAIKEEWARIDTGVRIDNLIAEAIDDAQPIEKNSRPNTHVVRQSKRIRISTAENKSAQHFRAEAYSRFVRMCVDNNLHILSFDEWRNEVDKD